MIPKFIYWIEHREGRVWIHRQYTPIWFGQTPDEKPGWNPDPRGYHRASGFLTWEEAVQTIREWDKETH